MTKKDDFENHLKLSEPLDGPDAANAAVEAFFKDVGAARQKHRIADCAFVVALNVRYADGVVGQAMTTCSFGDELKIESMLAFGLGREQATRREAIAKLIAGKVR